MKTTPLSRRLACLALSTAGLAGALVGATGGVAQAADDPVPAFDFTDCPTLPAGSDPLSSLCFNAVVTSGSMGLGKFKQAITQPIKMTFASAYNPETREYTSVFGKLRSEKMLVVPGIFGDPIISAVYAKPEYVGGFEISNFQVKMNLKIRLTNPFLGGTCTLGTDSNPIKLNLITGTTNPPPPNTPITGKAPVIVGRDGPVVIRSLGHVDNSFAVPGASGCALNIGLVNHIVNSQAGVPAAAGNNSMIYNEYVGYRTYASMQTS